MSKRDDSRCSCENLTDDQVEMALNYLMSRYAVNPQHAVAAAILHHIQILFERSRDTANVTRRQHYLHIFNMWYNNTCAHATGAAGTTTRH